MKTKLYTQEIEKLLKAPKNSIITYLSLSIHGGRDRLSFPKLETISTETGLNRRGIQRALSVLLERGYITQAGTTPRGVGRYRLPLYQGPYRIISSDDLLGLSELTKKGLENRLKNDAPRPEKMTPLDRKNDAPTGLKMTPLDQKNDAPIINTITKTINVNVNRKKMTPLKPPADIPHQLTLDEDSCFIALFSKWRDKAISSWTSQDPIKQFFDLAIPAVMQFGNRKHLIDELRVFDAYLMELEIRRTGALDQEWTGAPVIYARHGWRKGLERWLSSPSPSMINPQRRALIRDHGFEFEEAPKKAPEQAPKVETPVDTPEDPIRDFVGSPRALYLLKYLTHQRQKYPDWEDLYENLSKTTGIDDQDLLLCKQHKQLEDLGLIIQTSRQLEGLRR